MSKYKIEITYPAENDLREIGNYIAHDLLEPEIAKKVGNKIGSAIFSLEELPQRNSLVSDERLALQGIRKIVVDNLIVFYIIGEENKVVTVVRILYGKRDWMNLL